MSPHPAILLGLVLCLAQLIHMKYEVLLTPSISAEPHFVIPRGKSVTFVCQGPAQVKLFRLEKEGRENNYRDAENESQVGSSYAEARFSIDSVTEKNAGRYRCVYHMSGKWSEYSDHLELIVTEISEDFSSPCTEPSHETKQGPSDDSNDGGEGTQEREPGTPASLGLRKEYLYILTGVFVIFLLCLLLLVIFLYHKRKKKQGLPSSKDAKQRPQQRPSPAVDVLERTAVVASIDELPEKDRETDTSAPAAGDTQEVTYAQLDHWALTQRTAHAVSPQSMEPMVEYSTYAAVARH
ncbi:leukocyte-associated immunoglobulin-like receptor 1 [Carlito syrichta]|uniref:Leukocyte-associated immunoglobulin-like receptor 1 n=1 Tax=Carlito syrichta TaxID=1868482 RepID=A0A3Q0EEL5_CARSF|nr:leukocyte-associated immunoglobulin-like receptor 1 [Carlito syrichta]